MSTEHIGHDAMSRRSFLKGAGAFGLAAASAAVLAACSGGAGSTSSNAGNAANANATANAASGTSNATGAASGKVLVAYYSAQGHTQVAAEAIASALGADTFVITPANPYSDDDLNFNNEDSRVVQEYQNEDQRDTELVQNAPDNFADYDTVFVGYPIWWGDSAWAMRHFASENDFTGKTVYPFCTSLSSGLGSSGTNLADLAGTGDWQDGRRFSQNVDTDEVTEWAQGLSA